MAAAAWCGGPHGMKGGGKEGGVQRQLPRRRVVAAATHIEALTRGRETSERDKEGRKR